MPAAGTVLSLALALVPAQRRDTLDDVLRRHIEALGQEDVVRNADFVAMLTGVLRGQQVRLRLLVRRQPFGYREDWLPPQGQGTSLVSDGRYAWMPQFREPMVPKTGAPLADDGARALLEHAFFEGFLYLDGERTAGRCYVDPRWKLPAWPGLPAGFERDVEVIPVHFSTPAGTLVQYHFDSKDGRLLAITTVGAGPWIRFSAFKKFGPLTLPSQRAMGVQGGGPGDVDVMTLDTVQFDVRHPDVFFAGCSAPRAWASACTPARSTPCRTWCCAK
jgi:hypothetical protein